ncbi:MAG: M1 family metallopeptidase [Calditrichaeota bacterium]|nr:M1 family metallopeptidase [Calditrichota bacterium]
MTRINSWIVILGVIGSLGLGNLSRTMATVPLSPRIASYTMDVRLDVNEKKIYGREVLTWVNPTSHPASDLQFHLYYNAWMNERSSWLSSTRYARRAMAALEEDDWGYCDVQSIKLLGETPVDLTPQMRFIQPDDGNPHDRTVLQVLLPQPVQPGDTIQVEIVWVSKVPRPFARTGVVGNYYFIAQWFPKIGVFEEGGRWNCHQFIQTEFYADYGVYDVRLTVPTGWVVGATGKEIETVDNGDGTTTHRFYQEDVHDFVWTTSPDFLVFTDRFEEPNLPPVDLRLLLQPYNRDKKDRYFEATKIALRYYGGWFGAYPYDHLTIVDPAYQSRSGGMEYPTLFTGGTRWLAPPETRQPESVTIHEAGHQFWYGVVGNNEFEYAWIDEGFNTYSQSRVMSVALDPPILHRRYLEGLFPILFPDIRLAERFDGADAYDGFRSILKSDRMSQLSYRYGPGAYRINSYNKPALMLRTLENYLGWETFRKILSTFYERWKFRHPRPQDFFSIVNEISGQNMDWFFEQTYNSSNVFDYAVDRVIHMPYEPTRGWVLQDGELVPLSEVQRDTAAADTARMECFRNLVYLRRWGEAIFPVTVEVVFTSGDTVVERWDGKERWTKFEYVRSDKVEQVVVDPDRVLVLDVNRTNNSWKRQTPARLASWKWASKWMIWLQHKLEFMAFFH